MTPISAMLNPVADPGPASTPGAADMATDGGGFSDALQRAGAGAGQRKEIPPPGSEPAGSARGSAREAGRTRTPVREPADKGDMSGATDADAVDEGIGHETGRIVKDQADDGGAAVAMTEAGLPRPGERSAAQTPIDGRRVAMSGKEGSVVQTTANGRPGTTPATDAADRPGMAADAGTESSGGAADTPFPTTGGRDEPARSTIPATAMNPGQASSHAAAMAAAAASIDAQRPAGGVRRPGVGTMIDPAARSAAATGISDAAMARGSLVDTRMRGATRATPGAVIEQLPASPGPADVGAERSFDDALLAALAPDTDPRAGLATSTNSPTVPGGPRPITLPIAAPLHSPAFPQALGQQLALALRMDLGQAELVLSPAELGPVRVELSLDGDSASVHFAAIHPETRQALEQSLPELRALFEEQGLSLADTHVGAGFHRDDDAQPMPAAPSRETDQRSGTTTSGAIHPTGVRSRPDALVDLFA
ncbi:MAG: flagellar hook-length control protein FliK [Burkholderiaceae bacterium]